MYKHTRVRAHTHTQDLEEMDTDDIMAKQLKQMEKEMKDKEGKLKAQEKKVRICLCCVPAVLMPRELLSDGLVANLRHVWRLYNGQGVCI